MDYLVMIMEVLITITIKGKCKCKIKVNISQLDLTICNFCMLDLLVILSYHAHSFVIHCSFRTCE